MITLPMLTTTTAASASVATSAAGDTAASGQSDLLATTATGTPGDAKAAPAFLQLLGDRLLTLVKQQASGQQPTTAASGDATTDASALSASAADKTPATGDLNSLLATLDSPEALTALLKGKTATSGDAKETRDAQDDNSASQPVSLSSSDMQALQALFAMLPHNAPQPVASQQANSLTSSDLRDEISGSKGKGQATLASLLGSGNAKTDAAEGAKADAKADTSATLASTSGQGSQATVADSAKSASFQQVLNNVSKDADKENSSSAQNATITNTVMSAATATQTPTATSLVTAPATPQLNAQLGSQEWQQALGQQVLMFSRNGQHSAELRLHPEDLGSIQISLQLNNDQANLNMVSSHSQVRAALEAAIPHLRHALAESGISLGQSNVSSDAFAQGQASGQQQEQRNNNRGNTFSLTQENESDAVPVAVPASLQGRAAGSGAVDIFA